MTTYQRLEIDDRHEREIAACRAAIERSLTELDDSGRMAASDWAGLLLIREALNSGVVALRALSAAPLPPGQPGLIQDSSRAMQASER